MQSRNPEVSPARRRASCASAFTLVELMVSMVVLSTIMLASVQLLNQTQATWKQSVTRIEQFREARMAFETITQNLRQALLNTYLTYKYNDSATPTVPTSKDESPQAYIRQSELQFLSGRASDLLQGAQSGSLVGHAVFFQARLGVTDRDGYEALNRLLCGRGYFVLHGDDEAYRPSHVTGRRTRFRLWEYRPPSEGNAVYSVAPGKWFADAAKGIISASDSAEKPSFTRPAAENIVALIISPQVTAEDAAAKNVKPTWIAPDYAYDSTRESNVSMDNPQGTQHLLPPVVVVTLVAIDEASARNLEEKYQGSPPELVPRGAFALADNYENDLRDLERKLQDEKLSYRIFSSAISMRNSKWGLLK